MTTPYSMSDKVLALATEAGAKIKALSSSLGLKISKTDADAAYLAKTGKAASATLADKATADKDGNVISTTYATKAENANKLDASANAVSASKWASERTITLGGDVTGSVAIDGSKNVTLTATVADDSHNHVISNVDGLQSALDAKASKTELESATATAKSYTDTKVADLVNSAPTTLDTLGEIAEALEANDTVVEALNSAIGTKANSSEVVKLTGAQTIAGVKTFSEAIAGSITGNAATATKATQDGSGNVITSTYLKKSEKYVHPSHTAKASGFYKVTVDALGHVSATTAVTKADITGLGIPAQDTTYTLSSFGITATAAELNYCDGVTSNIQTQLNGKLSTTGTAAKATADANGANIATTYAKTASLGSLATKSSVGSTELASQIKLGRIA